MVSIYELADTLQMEDLRQVIWDLTAVLFRKTSEEKALSEEQLREEKLNSPV